MIMVVAIVYIFFILIVISSLVENYFQKIVSSPPEKSHSPLFTHTPTKCMPPPFANIKNFSALCRKEGEGHCPVSVKIQVFQFFLKWICTTMRTTCSQNLLDLFSAQFDIVYWSYCPKYPSEWAPLGSEPKNNCFFQIKSTTTNTHETKLGIQKE